MDRLIIDRIKPDTGKETIGHFGVEIAGVVKFKGVTLELPDKGNARSISCVPPGTYPAEKVGPTKNIPYDHIALSGVPNRDGICVHRANYFTQLRGCVAVGKEHKDLNKDGEQDVTDSKNTLDEIMDLLPNKFEVVIR